MLVAGCEKENIDIAYITNGNVQDEAGSAYSCMKGVEQYASDSSLILRTYGDDFGQSVTNAVSAGAKKIVVYDVGNSLEVLRAAASNPTVDFYCVDFGRDCQVKANIYSIDIDEYQLGFLAGYSCVAEGLYTLGIQSDEDINSQDYASAFISGAEYAAKEKKLKENSIKIFYDVSGTDLEKERISSWADAGCQAIFCTEDTVAPAYDVLSASDVLLIGQDGLRESCAAGCVKDYGTVIYNALKASDAETFPGGTAVKKVMTDGICSFVRNAHSFSVVTGEEIEKVEQLLIGGEIKISVCDVYSAVEKRVSLSEPGIIDEINEEE